MSSWQAIGKQSGQRKRIAAGVERKAIGHERRHMERPLEWVCIIIDTEGAAWVEHDRKYAVGSTEHRRSGLD